MKRELQRLLLEQQKNARYHKSLEDEFTFYRQIQSGDLSVLLGDMKIEPTEEMGVLSDDPLRNQKYHLIILLSMMTRFCIEGGLDSETAYTMSDMYIRRADKASGPDVLSAIKRQAITAYTTSMHDLKKKKSISLHVAKSMDYISGHITEPLDNKTIAEAAGVNPDYLSKLFRQETEMSLSQYVLQQKCETAKYMLENSAASCTEISAFLGFSSCSHFISRFRQVEQMTPEAWRKKQFRNIISSF